MKHDLSALLQLFENKVASLWQIDGQLMECIDDERAFRLEHRQRMLQKEVDALRTKLISAIDGYTNEN